MTGRTLILLFAVAGCGQSVAPPRPVVTMTNESFQTSAPYGHILTNTAVWSLDSQWIVYDVRSDPAGDVFDGTRIERVNVNTKQVEVLYESKNGACVGVATVNPKDGRVVFIHGPENPTPDWSYSACHREGVIVDPAKPGVAIPLEARDIVPPFTVGALRGGTHVHTWDSTGTVVSFTYEDHVLTHGTAKGKEPNRRTIGIAFPSEQPVLVPKTHARNRDGTYYSELVVKTVANPKPGSDEIGLAFEEGWIPGQNRLTFVGEVVAADGRKVNELFLLERRNVTWNGAKSYGIETSLPPIAGGSNQTRLTRFAEIPNHKGITTSPRHWPRASPDGKRVAFLTENGTLNFTSLSPPYETRPLPDPPKRRFPVVVTSAFSWHPNGRYLFAVVDTCICQIDVEEGHVRPLTPPSNPPPRPEACVVSPDGTKLAYVKPVNGINQIFVIGVP